MAHEYTRDDPADMLHRHEYIPECVLKWYV
jgi:hypothetical protein